jgi:hypothetical protein
MDRIEREKQTVSTMIRLYCRLKEKNHQLYLRQKELLDTYLRTGAISQEQHDKSLHDLTVKMGYGDKEQKRD